MNIDDILWEELECGPVTIKELTARFERRVRDRRERLRVRGIVIREGRGGAHRQFTYRMQTRGPKGEKRSLVIGNALKVIRSIDRASQ
jgi:hypothetical protein